MSLNMILKKAIDIFIYESKTGTFRVKVISRRKWYPADYDCTTKEMAKVSSLTTVRTFDKVN